MADETTADLDQALLDPSLGIDPYPTYELLREHAPVFWSEALRAWVVSRHADVNAILRDWDRFSNVGRVTQLLAHFDESERERFTPLEEHFASGMVHADPPDHTKLRRIVSRAFTSRTVAQLAPRIEQLVAESLDAAAERGTINLIADLAYPLPATVIGDLLGAPVEDADLFKQWSSDLGAFQGAGRSDVEVVATATASLVTMRGYLRELAEDKRGMPGDDMLSGLVNLDEETLTEDELLSFCVTMLTAGHETTTSTIGNGMLALLRDRDRLAELAADPGLVDTAVEEFIRYDAPLQRTWRRVSADTTFEGHAMSENDLVVVLLASANRDPSAFDDPDRLVLDRNPNRHVGFGVGVHFCLGAPLARLEARIVFRELFTRFSDFDADTGGVAWQVAGVFRCVEELPMTLVAR